MKIGLRINSMIFYPAILDLVTTQHVLGTYSSRRLFQFWHAGVLKGAKNIDNRTFPDALLHYLGTF
jgi:hypothetical protein